MDLRGVPGIYNKALQPQWDVMTRVVSNLVQQAGVRTIYLEGSLARGTASAGVSKCRAWREDGSG